MREGERCGKEILRGKKEESQELDRIFFLEIEYTEKDLEIAGFIRYKKIRAILEITNSVKSS